MWNLNVPSCVGRDAQRRRRFVQVSILGRETPRIIRRWWGGRRGREVETKIWRTKKRTGKKKQEERWRGKWRCTNQGLLTSNVLLNSAQPLVAVHLKLHVARWWLTRILYFKKPPKKPNPPQVICTDDFTESHRIHIFSISHLSNNSLLKIVHHSLSHHVHSRAPKRDPAPL